MNIAYWVLGLVALQRLVELIHARRNAARLLAAGGIEHGAGHYRLFVLLHGAWLIGLFLTVPAAAPANPVLLGFYGLLFLLRIWTLASLGRFWTTRIITLPDAPLIGRGPYRLLRHPNYLIVVAEIAVLPLAVGQWMLALVFSILNLPLLWHRIRVEEAALADRR